MIDEVSHGTWYSFITLHSNKTETSNYFPMTALLELLELLTLLQYANLSMGCVFKIYKICLATYLGQHIR